MLVGGGLVMPKASLPSGGASPISYWASQGELLVRLQFAAQPVDDLLAGETIPDLDTLLSGVWGMKDLMIITYPLRGSLLSSLWRGW
jgi:hypothetical protein